METATPVHYTASITRRGVSSSPSPRQDLLLLSPHRTKSPSAQASALKFHPTLSPRAIIPECISKTSSVSLKKNRNSSNSQTNIQLKSPTNNVQTCSLRHIKSHSRDEISKKLTFSNNSSSSTRDSDVRKLQTSHEPPISRNSEDAKKSFVSSGSETKKLGIEILETTQQRKVMEEQVSILEARIRKLQLEEQEMIKKINETSTKTEKVLENKKKRQEKLNVKEFLKKYQEDQTKKKKEELIQVRQENKNKVKEALLNNFKKKHDLANIVKMETGFSKVIKDEMERTTIEKNRSIVRKAMDQKTTKPGTAEKKFHSDRMDEYFNDASKRSSLSTPRGGDLRT